MKSTVTDSDRVDALIITVGTRQVGWRCQDGAIRCFGADGDRGHPPHIQELYRELGIERGYHEEGQSSLWSVRDLGYRYYEYCQEWLGGDFSAVQLLLDEQIINDSISQALKHIVLWGTDQPEIVPWGYRRADTYWLAKLMEGKIKQTWSEVKVDVLHPVVAANNRELIRQEIEGFILPIALKSLLPNKADEFVLMIQNKGAVPAVAEGLEICAAALVRQCQVVNAIPEEPQPLYNKNSDNVFSSRISQEYKKVFIGDYFWPLERIRIISAWERGDFLEAQIWLKSHQHRHKVLYQLAGYLSFSANWEMKRFIEDKNIENGWLQAKALKKIATTEQISSWKEQLLILRQNKILQVWESFFLIELQLKRQNFTSAFIQFSQTVERLLYLRSETEDWLKKRLILPPEHLFHLGNRYEPSFNNLIDAWCKLNKITTKDKWYQLLNTIRNTRNNLVHKAEPVTLTQLRNIWINNGFPVEESNESSEVLKLMTDVLMKVCDSSWSISQTTLLKSLYEWGLAILRSESTASIN